MEKPDMEKRPKHSIPLTPADSLAEWLGWTLLVINWLIVLRVYGSLPDTIPTHFNLAGEADGFGSSLTLFLIPVISTVSLAGMSILARFPEIYNYPVKITPENAFSQYTAAVRLVRWLKVSLALVFLLISVGTTASATGGSGSLGIWFLPLVLLLINLPLAIYLIRVFRNKK